MKLMIDMDDKTMNISYKGNFPELVAAYSCIGAEMFKLKGLRDEERKMFKDYIYDHNGLYTAIFNLDKSKDRDEDIDALARLFVKVLRGED